MIARILLFNLFTAMLLVLPIGQLPVATAAAAEVMTEEQAGRVYLRAACDANEATRQFRRAVRYGSDNLITLAEVRRRLPAIKLATGKFATSKYRFARALRHSPAAWPAVVAGPIDTTIDRELRRYRLLQRAANARTARGWMDWSSRAIQIPSKAATIRLRLDLPPPGRGC